MRKILVARIALAFIGIVVWGYGQRVDDPNVRLTGIVVLGLALLLRFVPRRWLEDEQS